MSFLVAALLFYWLTMARRSGRLVADSAGRVGNLEQIFDRMCPDRNVASRFSPQSVLLTVVRVATSGMTKRISRKAVVVAGFLDRLHEVRHKLRQAVR